MAFKMKGYSAFDKNDELPKGFYDSYESTNKKNVDGKTLNMGATKTASTKSGTFTPIYT